MSGVRLLPDGGPRQALLRVTQQPGKPFLCLHIGFQVMREEGGGTGEEVKKVNYLQDMAHHVHTTDILSMSCIWEIMMWYKYCNVPILSYDFRKGIRHL